MSNITDRFVPRHLLLNRDLPLEADLPEDEIVRVLAHVVDHLGDRHRDGGEDDEDGDEEPVEDVSEQEVSGPRALHHQPEVGILDDNVPGNIEYWFVLIIYVETSLTLKSMTATLNSR